VNVGITLKQAEKYFGPSVIGKDRPDNTISVIANPVGRGETYVGLPGIRDDAQFYIHFPQSIDLTTIIGGDHRTNYRRQPADHIVGLRKDGAFSGQNRHIEVDRWLGKSNRPKGCTLEIDDIGQLVFFLGYLQSAGQHKLAEEIAKEHRGDVQQYLRVYTAKDALQAAERQFTSGTEGDTNFAEQFRIAAELTQIRQDLRAKITNPRDAIDLGTKALSLGSQIPQSQAKPLNDHARTFLLDPTERSVTSAIAIGAAVKAARIEARWTGFGRELQNQCGQAYHGVGINHSAPELPQQEFHRALDHPLDSGR
jgi:hypothetical protein